MLTVGLSGGRGRGVFATEPIPKGKTVIRDFVVVFDSHDLAAISETKVIRRYYWDWANGLFAIVLGWGSLINHSYSPNVRFFRDESTMVFTAITDIQTGQELLINYNGDSSEEPVSFEVI